MITIRKAIGYNFNFTNDPTTNEVKRLVNNGFAYCLKEATLSTTGRSELEYVKYLGQISTFMRGLTSKDEVLSVDFNNIDETESGINNSSLKQTLIKKLTESNSGKIKRQLPLEHLFGFCKTFQKVIKNLGFHLTFKTNVLQNIFFTTIATDINVTNSSLYLFVPILIPNTETQVMFIEPIRNNSTIT